MYIKHLAKYNYLFDKNIKLGVTKIDEIKTLDESTKDYKVAEDMLMGKDDFCMNYITFCREG